MLKWNGNAAHAWNNIQSAGNSAEEKGAAMSESGERTKDTVATAVARPNKCD